MSQRIFDRLLVVSSLLIIGLFIGHIIRPAEVLARWILENTPATCFRVHHSDVREWNPNNQPRRIRCPECGGQPWVWVPVVCWRCHGSGTDGMMSLFRAVVIVPDSEPTSYLREAPKRFESIPTLRTR